MESNNIINYFLLVFVYQSSRKHKFLCVRGAFIGFTFRLSKTAINGQIVVIISRKRI